MNSLYQYISFANVRYFYFTEDKNSICMYTGEELEPKPGYVFPEEIGSTIESNELEYLQLKLDIVDKLNWIEFGDGTFINLDFVHKIEREGSCQYTITFINSIVSDKGPTYYIKSLYLEDSTERDLLLQKIKEYCKKSLSIIRLIDTD